MRYRRAIYREKIPLIVVWLDGNVKYLSPGSPRRIPRPCRRPTEFQPFATVAANSGVSCPANFPIERSRLSSSFIAWQALARLLAFASSNLCATFIVNLLSSVLLVRRRGKGVLVLVFR